MTILNCLENNMTDATKTIENGVPEGWVGTTLGEVAEIVGGTTPSTKNDSFWNGDIPWITPKDLSGNVSVYIKNGERNVTEIALKNTGIKLLPKNSVLFSSRAPIGYIAINEIPVTTNQGFKSLIPNEESNFKFLYYWLKQNSGNIEKQASGSTFMEVSGAIVKQIPILLPPLPEQVAIADVLSSFDDKIELLREQNKTLEEMGQALFNYEFRMVNGELVKAQEILEFEKGVEVGSKNYFENKNDLENPEMFYRVGNISNNGNLSSLYCEKDLLKNRIFKSDDVLVSFDGTVGRVFIGGNGGYSSGIRKIFAKEINIKSSFLYFWAKSKEVQETINLYSEGTTIQHAGKSIPYLEIISDQENINKITEPLDPVFTKILDNLYQIRFLARSRDELLPRLMRGEVRVNF